MTGALADRIPHPTLSLPVSAGILGLFAWWVVAVPLGVPSFLLPSPVAVAHRLAASPGLYLHHASYTFAKVAIGGAIGVGGGFLLGLTVTYNPRIRRAIYPYLVTVRVLPTLALAPVLLLYFGMGFETAVVFVALVSFFPMVVNTVAGLRRPHDREFDLLRSVDADSFRASLAIRLPYAAPDLLAGLKQSVTLAVVGAVVAEWVVASSGLGYLVLLGSENVLLDLMLASLVVLVGGGLALFAAVDLLGRAVPWLSEL